MNPIKAAVVYLLKERIARVSLEISDLADVTAERFKDDPQITDVLKARIAEIKRKQAELEKLLSDVEAHRCPKAEMI